MARDYGTRPAPGRTAGRVPWLHQAAARSSPARLTGPGPRSEQARDSRRGGPRRAPRSGSPEAELRASGEGGVDGTRIVMHGTARVVVTGEERADHEGFPGREQLGVLQLEVLRRRGRCSGRHGGYSGHGGLLRGGDIRPGPAGPGGTCGGVPATELGLRGAEGGEPG